MKVKCCTEQVLMVLCLDVLGTQSMSDVHKVKALFYFHVPLKRPSSSQDSPPPPSYMGESRSIHGPPTADLQSHEVCLHICLRCIGHQQANDNDVAKGVDAKQCVFTGLLMEVQSFALYPSWIGQVSLLLLVPLCILSPSQLFFRQAVLHGGVLEKCWSKWLR